MPEHPLPEGGTQRTVYITNEMWAAAKRARHVIGLKTDDDPPTLSELVRWGLYRELRAIKAGDYEPPPGYDATVRPGPR